MAQKKLHNQTSTFDQQGSNRNNRLLPWGMIVLMFVLIAASSTVSKAQNSFSIGMAGGVEKNLNHLYDMNETNTDYFPDFNFGVEGIYSYGDRLRFRGGLFYENMSYTREYNIMNDLPNRLDNTVLSISNLDFIPRVDFRLFSLGKLDLLASAGFHFEIFLGDYERSTLANGESYKSDYTRYVFQKGQVGAIGGLIFKYNVSDKVAIKLAPDYTYFFNKFYEENDKNLQRVSGTLGIEWKF
ncbi:MAG: hypothetical protein JXR22_09365 [Prolixibacteraceae bacterium]|nr:hypothetical protein [Prolixibacteraceae bacterium]